jgi:hypothetical protein
MTNSETLIASLAVQDPRGVTADDGYIDWSSRDGDRRAFEVGADGDAVTLWMTREDMVRLHAALTVYLLTNPE